MNTGLREEIETERELRTALESYKETIGVRRRTLVRCFLAKRIMDLKQHRTSSKSREVMHQPDSQ